jgi:hypothetical protein
VLTAYAPSMEPKVGIFAVTAFNGWTLWIRQWGKPRPADWLLIPGETLDEGKALPFRDFTHALEYAERHEPDQKHR